MSYPYSRRYTPPAPVIEVRFEVYGEDKSTDILSAFVDSGADGTIVPYRYLQPLGLRIDNRKYLRGQWGERQPADIELIVGRNVLNYLRVVLNGLKQSTEIYEY